MKSIARWQLLEEAFVNLTSRLNLEVCHVPRVTDHSADRTQNPHAALLSKTLPASAASWKLTTAREIVYSGFQQELYASYERPLAYWCGTKILEQHLEVLDTLKESVPAGENRIIEHRDLRL